MAVCDVAVPHLQQAELHRGDRCEHAIAPRALADLPSWLGHRFSTNRTGIDTHMAIVCRPCRAG